MISIKNPKIVKSYQEDEYYLKTDLYRPANLCVTTSSVWWGFSVSGTKASKGKTPKPQKPHFRITASHGKRSGHSSTKKPVNLATCSRQILWLGNEETRLCVRFLYGLTRGRPVRALSALIPTRAGQQVSRHSTLVAVGEGCASPELPTDSPSPGQLRVSRHILRKEITRI